MEWTHRYLENSGGSPRSLFGDEGEALTWTHNCAAASATAATTSRPWSRRLLASASRAPRSSDAEVDAQAKDIFYSMFEGSLPQSAYPASSTSFPRRAYLSNSPYNAAMLDLAVTNLEMVQLAIGPAAAVMVVRATLENAEWRRRPRSARATCGERQGRSFSAPVAGAEAAGLDLLGIRLGISENEADNWCDTPIGRADGAEIGGRLLAEHPAFSDTTVYVSADGHEGIALIYEAGTGERRVLGVTRKIYAPGWGLSRTDVTASVLKKYGQPAFEEGKRVFVDPRLGPRVRRPLLPRSGRRLARTRQLE